MNKHKAVLNIPIDRLHDYSTKAIREFVMENDYQQHLKDILPEIEFGRHGVKDDMFQIQMTHKSFPAVGECEEFLNYSMGQGFIFEGKPFNMGEEEYTAHMGYLTIPHTLSEDQIDKIKKNTVGPIELEEIKRYIIKDIPTEITSMQIWGKDQEPFKKVVSDYLEKEYIKGFNLVSIDFRCRIAIFIKDK